MLKQSIDTDKFKVGKEESVPVVIGYAWGRKPVDPASEKSLAKEAYDSDTGRTKYFVKCCIKGADCPGVYNPRSPTFSERNQYKYREVKKEPFEIYLNFIETGNILLARQAERLINV